MDSVSILSFLMAAGGPVIFWLGYRRMYRYRLIKDTPTSKIRSMAMGIVEIHGTADAKSKLSAPFSGSPCLYYRYEVKEYRVHVHRDSKGRTSTTHSWDTIESGEKRTIFMAKDDTGEVPVDPKGAEFRVELKRVFVRKASGIMDMVKAFWGEKGNKELLPLDPKRLPIFGNRVGDRRYFEYFIEPESPIFIIGTAMIVKKKIVVAKGENERSFMIADRSEEELLKRLFWEFVGMIGGGAIIFILGIYIWIRINAFGG